MPDGGSQMIPSFLYSYVSKGCAHLFFILIFLKFQYLCETQNHGKWLSATCFRNFFILRETQTLMGMDHLLCMVT